MHGKSGELGHPLDAIERALGAALESRPIEARGCRHRAKTQHEAIHQGRRQQRLGRPAIPGATEFARRIALKRRESR